MISRTRTIRWKIDGVRSLNLYLFFEDELQADRFVPESTVRNV